MQRIERTTIGVLLGAVPIILGFLAGWWIGIPLVSESWIILCAMAGLLVGTFIDVVFLKSWVRNAYSMKPWIWMTVYLFYSFGMFGFFMGVPVFNVVLALPAGIFVGGWLVHCSADAARVKRAARQSAAFTAGVLALVCIASATIALVHPFTGSALQGMLRLPFHVTQVMIICIILVGGGSILLLQWWLTLKSVVRAYRFFRAHAGSSSSS